MELEEKCSLGEGDVDLTILFLGVIIFFMGKLFWKY